MGSGRGKTCAAMMAALVAVVAAAVVAGCDFMGKVEIVDPCVGTFKVRYPRYFAPLLCTADRVRYFRVTSQTGKTLWKVRNAAGVVQRNMYFTYGIIPDGFEQVFPPGNARPETLKKGQKYFLEAPAGEGATGWVAEFAPTTDIPAPPISRR